MVNITRRIDGQTQISNEKNSVQICRKCIDDIIACLTNNKITVEASFAILDECKNEIRWHYQKFCVKAKPNRQKDG
ncbi:MAG: hypothetical protein OSJ61_24195, partial [Lachnospiraceae bacterium]|nr:hypothetical protein [Lachnospiraceae bacterium]